MTNNPDRKEKGIMRVICVDDEQSVLDNFEVRVRNFTQIQSLHLFVDAKEALEWVKKIL